LESTESVFYDKNTLREFHIPLAIVRRYKGTIKSIVKKGMG